MKLIKLNNDRYRLVEDNVKIEGTLDLIEERLINQGLASFEELDDALLDMTARGTNVAHFGMHMRKALSGDTTYGFMFSMKEVA